MLHQCRNAATLKRALFPIPRHFDRALKIKGKYIYEHLPGRPPRPARRPGEGLEVSPLTRTGSTDPGFDRKRGQKIRRNAGSFLGESWLQLNLIVEPPDYSGAEIPLNSLWLCL